ncbi:2-hydroxyacid dehydrogenase [Schaalia sp. 19OD2882]|uniref:2-hydroxyacid dehydrogenase n=1 Tax=Schaalia sp. 19OD2882 TaxID=2794089 RepID=UPI001C1ED00A|nr:2-hydroxyacid dehydrogenase [Schaalia sp. 19OD2882]QWW20228.1 2-hydroxyacid dehydrogenase [Schaalia sp. 19OD2882]
MSTAKDTRAVATIPQEWVPRVGLVEGVDVIAWNLDAPSEAVADATYVCMPYQVGGHPWHQLASTPKVRTVQLLTAGYDDALPHLPQGVALSNGRTIHETATAEQALTLTLASQRGALHWAGNHHMQTWRPMGFEPGLADRRVVILGYGSIGKAIARRVAPFEPASITAVASRRRQGDEVVETVHGIEDLPSILPQCDVLICVLPATPATAGLIDAEVLAALPDGALVVNVGRGAVVDTGALVEACASGRIRAGLDVTDPEPLPDRHPLWTTPGVLVSPHVGGRSAAFFTRAANLIRRQLKHVAAGEPLENIVA